MEDRESTHVSPEQDLVPRLVNGYSDNDGVGPRMRKIVGPNRGSTWFLSLFYFPREEGPTGELPPTPERVQG